MNPPRTLMKEAATLVLAMSWKVPAALVFSMPSKRSARGELIVAIDTETTAVWPAATALITA